VAISLKALSAIAHTTRGQIRDAITSGTGSGSRSGSDIDNPLIVVHSQSQAVNQ